MIRKVISKDFKEWKKLRLEAVKSCPESFGESYNNILKQDQKWFDNSLKNSSIFTYEKEGEMVGLIGVFSMKPGNMKHQATLFGLYVKPEHRKNRIGNKLVEHVINFTKPNYEQIHLTVTTNNDAAIFLYDKQGFVRYGTKPDALYIDKKYYSEYLMLKKI